MQKIFTLLVLNLTFVSIVSANDDWSFNNRVTFIGEFVYMKRNPLGKNHTIVQKTACPQPPPEPCICPPCKEPKPQPPLKRVLGTRNLIKKTDFEPGYRVGIFITPNQCRSLEANYMNIDDWHSEITKCGDCCNLRFPFCPLDCTCNFINANQATAAFNSRFQTAEVNYWEHVTPRRCHYFSFSWLLGFRFFDLDEKLNIAFVKGRDRSTYNIKTKNDLYGGQLGFNLQINPYRCISWDFTIKGGIFANTARQKTFLGDCGNRIILRDFGRSKTPAAYMGDGAVTLTAQIASHLNLHIGYEGIYIANLALATNQLQKRCFDKKETCCGTCNEVKKRINVKGTAFIQGGFVGVGVGF